MMLTTEKRQPLIYAHRGASGYAPENTMEAFQKAVDLKADGIELDVQLTKDDRIVVIHDEWLERVSDGKGWVKDHTLRELRNYNFNRTFEKTERAEIPTLSEVYELIRPTGLVINVELKTGIVFYEELEEKVLALTRDMNMEEQVIYSSFNHYTCRKLRALAPKAYIGFLYQDGLIDPAPYVRANGGNALHPALYDLQYPGFMESAQREGLEVNVWTVNEEDHLRLCCRYGVHGIITNYPDRALRIAGKNGSLQSS